MKKTPKKYRKQVDILKIFLEKHPSIFQIIDLEKQSGDPDFSIALVYAAAELKN